MELWDAYDAQGNKLGRDLVRGEPLPEGCYHLVADICVRHADGTFLVTLRDPNKPLKPNIWELSAGGSVLKGESFEEGARRELFEETGLAGPMEFEHFVSRAENQTLYIGYLCRYDGPKDAIRLQEGETVDYRWLAPRELLAFIERDDFMPSQRLRWGKLLERLRGEVDS